MWREGGLETKSIPIFPISFFIGLTQPRGLTEKIASVEGVPFSLRKQQMAQTFSLALIQITHTSLGCFLELNYISGVLVTEI